MRLSQVPAKRKKVELIQVAETGLQVPCRTRPEGEKEILNRLKAEQITMKEINS